MKNIITLLAGLIFGLGLIISGMTNPAKVIGFLDIEGQWDPSLAYVMIGAISIAFLGFRFVKNKSKTIFDDPIHLPGTTHVPKELIIGSVLFGAGWALAGFCPGPALVALGAGYKEAFIFVMAMIVGMYIHDHLIEVYKKR
ncbi:MAG: YeeE/YedE family protein [Methylophilaceae bacterium]